LLVRAQGFLRLQRDGGLRLELRPVDLAGFQVMQGDLADWRFVDSRPMCDVLNRLIREHGLSDGQFGKTSQTL